ncbi:MAG TPA: hypothetical protein D7I03_02765 [Candidatus Poseidoniales archaeon]|nr:MAG TPA: hypothetical protein D7I03_02765 [Candidatus Poseidoniales archaeon]HII50241.1 NTP transferase domain-containing protein [Candidatus Poseidoniaceae archaeon]
MAKSIPAIILSGGLSKRLGKPKALVEVNGTTLLEHAIDKLHNVGCNPIVVVVNKDLQFEALMRSKGAVIVVNKNPEKGRTGSLKIGLNSILSELGRMPKSVIMSPIDRPGWKSGHITKLLESNVSSCLLQNGKKGHPVHLVKSDLLNVINASDDTPLRDLVDFDTVEIHDGLLSLNIDTPDDLTILLDNSQFFDKL